MCHHADVSCHRAYDFDVSFVGLQKTVVDGVRKIVVDNNIVLKSVIAKLKEMTFAVYAVNATVTKTLNDLETSNAFFWVIVNEIGQDGRSQDLDVSRLYHLCSSSYLGILDRLCFAMSRAAENVACKRLVTDVAVHPLSCLHA